MWETAAADCLPLGAAKQGRGSEWAAGGSPEPRLTEPQRDRWLAEGQTDEGPTQDDAVVLVPV